MITDEQAKLGQEVAKTAVKGVELTEKFGEFLSTIIGPASKQVGGVLEDWTSFYRYKNLCFIADKVDAIHAKRQLKGKTIPIPPRTVIPLLNSAALEDDDALQAVWAKLIANSTDPNSEMALHPGYIEIIKQLSPDEALILESFRKCDIYPVICINHVPKVFEQNKDSIYGGLSVTKTRSLSYEKIFIMYKNHCANLKLNKRNHELFYLDNLIRLRIVELGYDFTSEDKPRNSIFDFVGSSRADEQDVSIAIPGRNEYMRITAYGEGFIAACIADDSTRK